MTKLDLSKEYPNYFRAKKKPEIVDFEPNNYVSISGVSAPEDPKFLNAIQALYPVVYTIKFMSKAKENDFVVPKMEAFWWVESNQPFDETPRDQWYWEITMRMPSFIVKSDLESAIIKVVEKKGLTTASEIYFKSSPARKCAQILHLGSYEEEGPTLEKLYAFIEEQGNKISGHHNELYLKDPMRTPVEKLKTILRYEIE